ncbi:MAG: hypothetical protein QNJ38_14030 [Prochloraceae cyanobacterium]|nr:hypothetical protein [Prochloraceae cyanobacterium]
MSKDLDSIRNPIRTTKAYKAIAKNINYRSPKQYETTQNIAVNLASAIVLAEHSKIQGLPKSLAEKINTPASYVFIDVARNVQKRLTPCYWLASVLAESLKITDIPEDWSGLKPFIDRGIILFPKNTIEYSGTVGSESIDWVYFEVMTIPEKLNAHPNIVKDKEPVILWTSSSNRLSIFYGTINLKNNISNDPSAPVQARILVEQVNKLLLNTMLVLNSKPDLLEAQESKLKGVGFGKAGKLPSTLARNPVWIGKSYSGVREYIKHSNRLIREPREHYRRGHWARRRHGTREKWQYKWHWIEPTLVNQNK